MNESTCLISYSLHGVLTVVQSNHGSSLFYARFHAPTCASFNYLSFISLSQVHGTWQPPCSICFEAKLLNAVDLHVGDAFGSAPPFIWMLFFASAVTPLHESCGETLYNEDPLF